MSTAVKNSTIAKVISTEMSVNYDGMLKEAVKHISKMSGDKWTNYNPSDPGITMLEFLCYALLDLGYKSTFSMKDLLSDEQDKIKTSNRLYKPRQILFSNPVTRLDFRKLLIDRAEDVKNIWVDKVTTRGMFNGIYKVYYELTDELKSDWLELISLADSLSKVTSAQKGEWDEAEKKAWNDKLEAYADFTESFNKQLTSTMGGVDALLYQYRNLGEVFFKPYPLKPKEFIPEGTYYLEKSSDVEQSIASIYFILNDYLSKYIKFYTYKELKSAGETVGEILQGPRLENGFIKDTDLLPKLQTVNINTIKSALVKDPDIVSVFSFNIQTDIEDSPSGEIEIDNKTSPFFNYQNAADLLLSNGTFKIYLGEQQVTKVDQSKINACYKALSAPKAVSSFNFKDELGPVMPTGKYRDLEEYHSVQDLFPNQFGLQADRSFDGYSTEKRAQIKQMKAYLMLFEQIIADHQAQMGHLDELLSFNSGVKVRHPLCKTYYKQALYDSPAAEFILKAYDIYKNKNGYISEYPNTNWENFKKDPHNTYEERLNKIGATEDENISRKNTLLSHVYARFGQNYLMEPLVELNPKYGNYDLARVENISGLLKNFALYGENLSRSYFLPNYLRKRHKRRGRNQNRSDLFTGLEYKFGLLFQLNAYYQGIVDVVSRSLVEQDPNIKIVIEPPLDAQVIAPREIFVSYYGQLILNMPFSEEDYANDPQSYKSVIAAHLEILKTLRRQTKGMVLIDNQLLIDNLQNEEWQIYKDGTVVDLEQVPGQGATTGTPKVVASNLRQVQSVLERNATEWADADVYVSHKYLTGPEDSPNSEVIEYQSVTSSDELFDFNVSLFLPSWVTKVNEQKFRTTFLEQFCAEGPLQLNYNLYALNISELRDLLGLRRLWLHGNHRLQEAKAMKPPMKKAVTQIIQFLKGLEVTQSL